MIPWCSKIELKTTSPRLFQATKYPVPPIPAENLCPKRFVDGIGAGELAIEVLLQERNIVDHSASRSRLRPSDQVSKSHKHFKKIISVELFISETFLLLFYCIVSRAK